MPTPRRGASSPALLLAALATNLAFDGAATLAAPLAPPHLLLQHAPEFVRQMLSPAVVSPAAAFVLSLIDLLLLGVVPAGTPRRTGAVAAWIFGFWLFAEGLLAWVWLSAPAGALSTGLAFGALRSLAAAWVLVRLSEPREPAATGAPRDEGEQGGTAR
jgi:hypothetical protein